MIEIDKKTTIFAVFLGLFIGLIISLIGMRYGKYNEKMEMERLITITKDAKKEYAECLVLADKSYAAELKMSCISRGYEFGNCPNNTVATYVANSNRGDFIGKCENNYKESLQ